MLHKRTLLWQAVMMLQHRPPFIHIHKPAGGHMLSSPELQRARYNIYSNLDINYVHYCVAMVSKWNIGWPATDYYLKHGCTVVCANPFNKGW